MSETRGAAPGGSVAWPVVQSAAALLVLGFFLWGLGDVLNPFLLFLALVVVLLPFRGEPGHHLLLGVAGMLTLFWVLATTGTLLAPFVVALGLAYLLDPLVDRLEARGMSRTVGILVLSLPVVAILVLAAVFGLPALGSQIGDFIDRVPVLVDRVEGWLGSLQERLRGVPLVGEEVLARIQAIDTAAVVTFLEEQQTVLAQNVWSGVLGIGRGLGSVLTVLGYVVLTPVLTFYLLRDWDRLTEHVEGLVPRDRREGVTTLAREYDGLLARYLRGQIIVALTIGAVTALGLWIASFPYALLIGAVVAVFSVVPYLGLVLSLIPAVIVALTTASVAISLVKVAVVFAVAQGLEGAVVSPRIVGESVGLHPVWVVLALAVGGFYFGFVGLLLAVPAAVGIKLLATRGAERWRSSDLYKGDTSAA